MKYGWKSARQNRCGFDSRWTKGDLYEWNQRMVPAVLHETGRSAAQLYVRPLWYGQAEYGDPLRRSGIEHPVHDGKRAASESDFLGSQLYSDDLGYFPEPFPEYLQAVPGKPEVPSVLRPAEGPAASLF